MAQRELYDFDEYHKKALAVIDKIKQQKPGAMSGKVGKNDIMMSVKDELNELIKNGYTIQQIAAAFNNDTFSILPKTITQILNDNKTKKRVTKRTTKRVEKQTTNKSSNDVRTDKSTFTIQKDNDDL